MNVLVARAARRLDGESRIEAHPHRKDSCHFGLTPGGPLGRVLSRRPPPAPRASWPRRSVRAAPWRVVRYPCVREAKTGRVESASAAVPHEQRRAVEGWTVMDWRPQGGGRGPSAAEAVCSYYRQGVDVAVVNRDRASRSPSAVTLGTGGPWGGGRPASFHWTPQPPCKHALHSANGLHPMGRSRAMERSPRWWPRGQTCAGKVGT